MEQAINKTLCMGEIMLRLKSPWPHTIASAAGACVKPVQR